MSLADPASHAGLLDAFGVPAPLRPAWPSRGGSGATRSPRWTRPGRPSPPLNGTRNGCVTPSMNSRPWHPASVRKKPWRANASDCSRGTPSGGDRRGSRGTDAARPSQRRTGGRRCAPRPVAAASGAARPAGGGGRNPADPALAALERAEEALAEAETLLTRLVADADVDPRLLEQSEERLFALRAAARKHGIAVPDLPALLDTLAARLAALETGAAEITALEQAARDGKDRYAAAAAALSAARRRRPGSCRRRWRRNCRRCAWTRPVSSPRWRRCRRAGWGPSGMDQVRFLIATNPGQEPGPLARVASGGELSRLMLAMKVVLSAGSAVPTLVFDEVDSGIGGATAAAVGERLVRVAEGVQVLVVTHSPQVAARGAGASARREGRHPRPHRDDRGPSGAGRRAARKSPGCWPARRSPTPPAPPPTICCVGRRPPQGLLV